MPNNRPTVIAEVTFLLASDGGRSLPPLFNSQYRPHIVIQSPDVRSTAIDALGNVCDKYLGICFLSATEDYQLGQKSVVTLELMYHPRVDYSEVQPEATFTIREGGSVVGYGRVLARHDNELH